MPRICYRRKRFGKSSRWIIRQANLILDEYSAQGFVLTLRQLYYQFVARDILPNNQKSYTNLGKVVGEARLAGLIDWEYLEDRTRNLRTLTHFAGPKDALEKLAGWYHVDMWASQQFRPEVWIEKDALVGVIEGVCEENDVPYFSCRGYTSLSEVWRAAVRMQKWNQLGQSPFIIHFGDHDPSGIDMSRDIFSRITRTFGSSCQFVRVALNMDQIDEYRPPPNPAKISDSRYRAYVREYGTESWELDALEPAKFRSLIEESLKQVRDEKQWVADGSEKLKIKKKLSSLAKNWGKRGNGKGRNA